MSLSHQNVPCIIGKKIESAYLGYILGGSAVNKASQVITLTEARPGRKGILPRERFLLCTVLQPALQSTVVLPRRSRDTLVSLERAGLSCSTERCKNDPIKGHFGWVYPVN